MDLKTVYHYTYFVYPFLVNERRYKDFLWKFLNDEESWSLIIRDNETDLNTHAYFLPYVKKFLFPTIYWTSSFRQEFQEMSNKKKLDTLASLTSVKFKYNIAKSYVSDSDTARAGISFGVPDIDLICFESGICFLKIKAVLDNEGQLYSSDILDFNYKFRTINPRYLKRKKTEGIFLKNQEFNGMEDFSGFIEKLLYGYEDVEKENIYFDRLFTYSYICLDQQEWNENRPLDEIINEFYKFQYVLRSDYGSTFDGGFKGFKDNTYTRWKYSIYGFSREAGVVFSSERENFNSTKLPEYFEHMYFYIFLLAFYQRIALILFSQELMTGGKKKIENLKDRFTKFTHFSWFSQITNSEQGMDIWKKWQKAFDLPELFDEVQKEYSEFYEFTVAKGQEKINLLLIVIYTISVMFSGLTLMMDFRIIHTYDTMIRTGIVFLLAMTVFIYPAYAMLKTLRTFIWKHQTTANKH